MRATDFVIEKVDLNQIADIGEYQLAEMHKELATTDSELYESFESTKKIRNFLSDYNYPPVIGETYQPISISTIPAGSIISVACACRSGALRRIEEPNLFFDFGSGEKPFPYNLEASDNFRTTILTKTVDEQEKFYEWLLLSFNGWRITRKEI